MDKYILCFDVKELEEIPYHWRMADHEIEDKIRDLRKQIYELQNSRKKQPKLVVFEGKDGEKNKLDKVRIFDGWNILGEKGEEKGLFCADSWHIPNKQEVEDILSKFNFKKEVKEVLKKQSENF